MKRFLLSVLALALLAPVAALAQQSATLTGAASADVGWTATLAPFNSFEWRAAPLSTALAVHLKQATVALQKGVITAAEAQAILDATDAVHATLAQAVKVCAQSNHSGRCTGSLRRAEELLSVAQRSYTALPAVPTLAPPAPSPAPAPAPTPTPTPAPVPAT